MIDATARVSPGVDVGDGVEIGRHAVVEGTGRLGSGAQVGHNAVVEGDFEIGEGCRVDHSALVRGRVRIGAGGWIFPFAAVGTAPEHRAHMGASRTDFAGEFGPITIGRGTHIREFATVNQPLPGGRTAIGSDCYVLAYSHVAHDVEVADSVTLATQALLGGHSTVGDHAYVGLGAETHQFTRIGRYAIVGMGSTILRDVLPYAVMIGARFTKINRVGMRRGGMGEDEIESVQRLYDGFAGIDGAEGPHAGQVREFVRGSKRGLYAPEWADVGKA